jgi:hypothetical protein
MLMPHIDVSGELKICAALPGAARLTADFAV